MNPRRPGQLTLETFDAPITVRRHQQGLHCPKCKSHFETIEIGTLEVERRTGCEGLWFDVLEWIEARELEAAERLDKGNPKHGELHDRDTGLLCPKCRAVPLTRLEVPHHAGLHIDKCPRCYGAFFDAGEFLEYRELTFTELLMKFWHVK